VKPKGLSLTVKIFLSTAAVVVVTVGVTLAVAAQQASRAADESVNRVLGSAREAINAQLAGAAAGFAEAATAFAENPGFRSRVESGIGSDVLDQAGVAANSLNAKWVQIIDADGMRLAKSDEPGAEVIDLGNSPEVASALGEESATGYGATRENELVQLAAVPIFGAGRIVGALLAAREIDDAYAAQVKTSAASQLEVVFYTNDAEGAMLIAASTVGRDEGVVRAVSSLPMVVEDSAETRVEIDLDGAHYVGLVEVLSSTAGQKVGGYLMLRDRDAEFASFARLQQSLLLSGALGIVAAALLSLLIANQITRPVNKLVEATRRAADGDYAADIRVWGTDEIGTLAGAFRAMLADLREKQALVEFLSGSVSGEAMTVQMAQMRPSLQQAVHDAGITPGSRFAVRYDVKEVLGVGGMGTVFKALDTELGEVIAIKTLKQDFLQQDPTALERFKSEIRLARRISHRNVVRTHDLGENSGIYFITMEYVEGKSLKELIRARGRLPLAITLSVGKQLARALEVAHEQGVIHRDIKPQNMVVEPDGVLKVMDFGIARLAARKADTGMTQAGTVIGTPEYMAPEQLSGAEVDHRVDIYAAGCVLYECLTGKPPFTADTPYQLIAKMLEETAPVPSSINAEVPAALDALVMAAIAKDPAGRPQTALALHDRLARIG
jgi:serine/threonine-protein kinase